MYLSKNYDLFSTCNFLVNKDFYALMKSLEGKLHYMWSDSGAPDTE